MSWLWGIIGALLASAFSEGEPVAALLGFATGWLLGDVRAQQRELESLRARVVRLETDSVLTPARPPEVASRPVDRVLEASVAPPPQSTPPPTSVARPTMVERPPVAMPGQAAVRPLPPPEWEVRLRATLVRWLSEGNVPVKLGVLVLMVGVAAALRYAAQRGIFSLPIELRLAGIALAAIAALAFGWRERERRRSFGLSLQGGALGTLLLTIFAAFRLYDVLPPGAAFAWMVFVVASGAYLALLQNAVALAVFSIAGGFLAPVLVSTGGGSHVALFSYYALLNAAVLGIVWLRDWRWLSRVGFAFTFVIGTGWGYRYYQPEFMVSTEPFLILFFLCYVALAVLDAARRGEGARDAVDGALVFGVPLCAFPLQAALFAGRPLALALSASVVALGYAGLAFWCLRRRRLETLGLSFGALAIGFATLAVPLALSARSTACAWVVQGTALIWLGLRLRRSLSCYLGAALHALAIAAYLGSLSHWPSGRAIVNGELFTGLLVTACVLLGAHRFERSGAWPRFGRVAFCAGCSVWTLSWIHEVLRISAPMRDLAWVAFLALTLAVSATLRGRMAWERAAWPIVVTLGVTLLSALASWASGGGVGWLAWSVALAAGCYALQTLDRPRAAAIAIAHTAWLATLAAVIGGELQLWSATLAGNGWSASGAGLPLAFLLWATWRRPRIAALPLVDAFATYRGSWFALASLALALWWLWSLALDGSMRPLAFVPLLNPLEPLQLASVLLVYGIWREQAPATRRTEVASAALVAGFTTLSMMTLRGVHHWADVPWNIELVARNVTQTSLSVVWSVLGVAAWIIGSRRGSRPVWLAGASLMGVVLAKLVLVDRTYTGDLSGIVSFVVVGLLMIGVGYFAPSPPRERGAERSG